MDSDKEPVLSLDQVLEYKYLGTFGSMWKTTLNKQKTILTTANKYKGSVIYISRDGPDVVDVIDCTWNNVAVPAILFGCEMLPLTEMTIETVERSQCSGAKYVLGVPSGAPNICAQTELGWKPFRQILYEKQLSFFFRALFLHDDRWLKLAMMEHLSGSWNSPYLKYISNIRSKIGMFVAPATVSTMMKEISDYFLASVNSEVQSLVLKTLTPLRAFTKASYVFEHEFLSVLAQFRLGVAGLGNRDPRLGHQRQSYCPLCPVLVVNDELHLVGTCPSVSGLRAETGITSFMNDCRSKNISLTVAYQRFVNGEDWSGNQVPLPSYIERGRALAALRKCWLSRW